MTKVEKVEILTKAIEKAIVGGWHLWDIGKDNWTAEKELDYHLEALQNTADGAGTYDTVNCLIFNHDFAKALWGERTTHTGTSKEGFTGGGLGGWADVIDNEGWQYHLQQMVIAEDPIKYLGDHI